MNPKTLVLLILVTAIVVVAAYFTLDRDTAGAAERTAEPEMLLPALATDVNDAVELEVTKAGQTATLVRQGDAWVCREAGGYRAAFDKVRSTLVALARLEIVEPMTQDPAQHQRLGVGADRGARAVLRDDAGGVLADVTVGDTRHARSGQEVYARLTDENQTWRCRAELALSADPMNWVDREILRLESSRPSRIEITHADGESLAVTRAYPAATNWDVVDLPDDRPLKSTGIANPLGTALSYLSFDEVKPADELPLGEHHTATARYATYDGMSVEVRVARIDDANWITVDVGYAAPPEPAGPAAPDDSEAAPEVDGQVDEPEGQDAPSETPDAERQAELAAEAAELDARVEGWAYRIPQFKADLFLRRMDDLLVAPLEEHFEADAPLEHAEEPLPEPDPGAMEDDGESDDEPAQGESDEPAQGESDESAEGESDESAEGESDESAEGDGDKPAQGESDEPAEGDGDEPAEGESNEPAEGDGEDGGAG